MWILFSPSEKKCLHHSNAADYVVDFDKDLICKHLNPTLQDYVTFLQTAKDTELQKLFGVKTLNLEELSCAQNLISAPKLPAIQRYIGVAFNALDYETLEKKARDYLKNHLLIFSNLFGILRPEDKIPYYDLKQGESFKIQKRTFNTKQFYQAHLQEIWQYLGQKPLHFLDLRAGFYQSCFALHKIPSTLQAPIEIYTPNFLKNGKILSHYAKFYRGILLRHCANAQVQCKQELLDLQMETLHLDSIQQTTQGQITQFFLTYHIQE